VFAHFAWNSTNGETWESPFLKLAELARPEKWSFANAVNRHSSDNSNISILRSYLNYTFVRQQNTGGLVYSPDGNRVCFNTGLRTRNEKDIFLTFYRNKRREEFDAPMWTFYCVANSYAEQMKGFGRLPEPPVYITDPSELLFDVTYDIEINSEHILQENSSRLPAALQSNELLALNAMEGAKSLLLENVRRNPLLPIPHWYHAESKIQLLLPLYLTNPDLPDLALILDKDESLRRYRVKTAITIDMAYVDARLICSQENSWLKLA